MKVLDFVQLGGDSPDGIRQPSVANLSIEKPCLLSTKVMWKLFSYQRLSSHTPLPKALLACLSSMTERILLRGLLGVRRKSRDPFNDKGVDDLLPLGRQAESGTGRARFDQPICQHEAAPGNVARIRKH